MVRISYITHLFLRRSGLSCDGAMFLFSLEFRIDFGAQEKGGRCGYPSSQLTFSFANLLRLTEQHFHLMPRPSCVLVGEQAALLLHDGHRTQHHPFEIEDPLEKLRLCFSGV